MLFWLGQVDQDKINVCFRTHVDLDPCLHRKLLPSRGRKLVLFSIGKCYIYKLILDVPFLTKSWIEIITNKTLKNTLIICKGAFRGRNKPPNSNYMKE